MAWMLESWGEGTTLCGVLELKDCGEELQAEATEERWRRGTLSHSSCGSSSSSSSIPFRPAAGKEG